MSDHTVKDRAEPRFPTDTSGVVEVIRGKAHSLEARIADVSATGFRMETAESLEPGETVRLSINGYQMLGEVRYCDLHESAYRVGIERVDDWTEAVDSDQPAPLGRPVLRRPANRIRAAALRELFVDPRVRGRRTKSPAAMLLVAVIAVAAWFGLRALSALLGHK